MKIFKRIVFEYVLRYAIVKKFDYQKHKVKMANIEEKREKLQNLHKVLLDAIAATEKDINQCSLEWLQLCDINSKQDKNQKVGSCEIDQQNNALDESLLMKIEDSTDINKKPINLSVTQIKDEGISEQEYDSTSD